jgi:hypothetical protein
MITVPLLAIFLFKKRKVKRRPRNLAAFKIIF